MSLDYIITSKLSIIGSTSSRLSLNSNGNSISLVTPSLLSNTYNIVLPSNIGLQDQILGLNSSLETDWINDNSSSVRAFSVSDTTTFTFTSASFVTIPSMTITPPAGTYFCIFNGNGEFFVEYAIFVNGGIISESFRTIFSGSINNPDNLNTCEIITVNGTETIDIRARGTSGTNEIFQRILVLYTVS